MKLVITGGAGFLGQRLARRLLARGHDLHVDGHPQPISELVLVDVCAANGFSDPRLRVLTGDITDEALLRQAIGSDVDGIFHLAAVVSSQAEANFDLGMRVNITALQTLLELCRGLTRKPRVVFTSSVAVYGNGLPGIVGDNQVLEPRSSYGMQKAIGELLIADYSRRRFINGRVLRLPTVCVRPGVPNQAASSFVSSIIREPLAGYEATCPVSPNTRLWLLSPQRAVEGLIHGLELTEEALGGRCAINLPGTSVSVAEMIATLERVAGAEVARRIRWQPNPSIEAIVGSWPGAWDTSRATALGFTGDAGFEAILNAFISEGTNTRQAAS